jgi:hypothetical protein
MENFDLPLGLDHKITYVEIISFEKQLFFMENHF